jgi:tRNA (guanosine-2'-O-)-methyltransferase
VKPARSTRPRQIPFALALGTLALCFACRANHGAPAATKGASEPSGAQLTPLEVADSGCISTGPERCFDATDDNCNGVIDEGCGVETGAVQFAIAWEPAGVDVDLLVTDPGGELAEVGRPLASGLVKQRDCPGRGGECRGQNFENVYLDAGAAEVMRGSYRVRVVLESLGGEGPPVKVRFGARVGGRSFGGTVRLERVGTGYEGSFVL